MSRFSISLWSALNHWSLKFWWSPVYLWAFLVAQMVENAGDMGSTPGLWRSPGEGHGQPWQSTGSQRNRHDWATKHSTAECTYLSFVVYASGVTSKNPLPNATSQILYLWPLLRDWRQKEKRAVEDSRLDSITDSMDMNLNKLQKIVEDRGAWHAAVQGVTELDMT